MITSSMKSNKSSTESGGRRRPSSLSVGFERRTRAYMYPVQIHHDFSDAKYDQIYQTKLDERRKHKDIVRCLTILRSGSDEERRSDDYCPRGLETMWSTESILRSKAAQQRVIDAVLDEQERQWDLNLNDASLVAGISARHSSNAVEIALLRASSDAAFARIYNPSPGDTDKESESSKCRPMSLPSTSSSTDDISTSPDSSSPSCSQQRTVLQNTLAKVLSSPDLTCTSISTNMVTMAKTRRHASLTGTHRKVSGGGKSRSALGA